MCTCEQCERHKTLKTIIDRRDPDELIKVLQEYELDLMHLSLDYQVLQATLDGSWPDSKQTLQEALEKINATDRVD